jgi:hypothetical protein
VRGALQGLDDDIALGFQDAVGLCAADIHAFRHCGLSCGLGDLTRERKDPRRVCAHPDSGASGGLQPVRPTGDGAAQSK